MRSFALGQRRFDHVLVAVACLVVVGLVSTFMLVSSHANPWEGILEVYRQNSGFCLTATGGTTHSAVVLDPCSKTRDPSQVWTLNDIRTADALKQENVQEFSLQSGAGANECLDGWGQSMVAGSGMYLTRCSATDNGATWVWGVRFTSRGYSSHQLATIGSASRTANALCLDDWGGSNAPGAKTDVWTCKKTGQSNQEWFEAAAPSGGSSGPAATSGGCTYNGTVAPCIGSPATGASGWGTPVFDDEFSGRSVDTSKWAVEGPRMPNNSQETACYAPSAVSENGGYLNESLLNQSCTVNGTEYQYTGSQINTNGHFNPAYGYFEARIYSPGSNGIIDNWGGFWLAGQNWPDNGEIDIFEGFHGYAGWHFMYPSDGTPVWQGGFQEGQDFTGWHIYAADWEPGSLKYYYDGKLAGTITRGVTSAPMEMLLTYSAGPLDDVGGPTSASQTMKVDYVRVWRSNSCGSLFKSRPSG